MSKYKYAACPAEGVDRLAPRLAAPPSASLRPGPSNAPPDRCFAIRSPGRGGALGSGLGANRAAEEGAIPLGALG